MNQIKINLEFGSALLPVGKNEAGQDVVPLKPICEEIGLSWADQHKKIQTHYFSRRLGTCIGDFPYAGQVREMVAIRLDRVATYLNTINPEQVRGNGNEAAADYLERKHEEWDNLIHEYESSNGRLIQQVTSAKVINIRTFISVSREKRATAHEADRKALDAISKDLAAELGIPYQLEISG